MFTYYAVDFWGNWFGTLDSFTYENIMILLLKIYLNQCTTIVTSVMRGSATTIILFPLKCMVFYTERVWATPAVPQIAAGVVADWKKVSQVDAGSLSDGVSVSDNSSASFE